VIIVSLLVSAAAFGVIAVQFNYEQDPGNQLALSNLDQRVPVLEGITNSIQRDRFCIPLSAYGRWLDSALPPDARIFVTDMLGPTNAPSDGNYFFLRNYLFPRDVEISLDGHAISVSDGFSGVPCDSPEILKNNGFDLMINSQLQLTPLTPKGVPKSE